MIEQLRSLMGQWRNPGSSGEKTCHLWAGGRSMESLLGEQKRCGCFQRWYQEAEKEKCPSLLLTSWHPSISYMCFFLKGWNQREAMWHRGLGNPACLGVSPLQSKAKHRKMSNRPKEEQVQKQHSWKNTCHLKGKTVSVTKTVSGLCIVRNDYPSDPN